MSVPSGGIDIVRPTPLPLAGTIGITAPAGPVKTERLQAAVKAIKSDGHKVVTAPSAFERHGLFAAPDAVRLHELEAMFVSPDVDAVFCARGGVGSSRLLPHLDTSKIAASRKPFLGFSDITALQWYLWAREKFISFSGPLAVEWDGGVDDATRRQAFNILRGTASSNLFGDFSRDSVQVLRGRGKVTGRLMPGNLTMITTLLGTPYLPDLCGTILMIEDVSEPPHRVDRMLFHLRNAGVLNNLAGLLAGDLEIKDDETSTDSVRTSLLDVTNGCDYPVAMSFPYGHGTQRMTLPVGGLVEFDADHMTLNLLEPVTEEHPV
ncbi:MAG: S66 peptidase family protein [Calditrichota bacterium]